jgi:uncharacterized protein
VANKLETRKARAQREAGDGPERSCAFSRATLAPDELIRFVLAPDGTIVPDLDCKLPGRGAWLRAERAIVEKALKARTLSRALKADAKVPEGLAQGIEDQLVRRTTGALSLANKAGLAAAGFQQVESGLEKGTVAVLIHGLDAAADGAAKLDRKFKAIQSSLERPAPVVTVLTINEISLAMGRPSVVHAALKSGGLAERFLREAGRLVRYRASSAASELVVTGQKLQPDEITEG